MLLLTSTKAKTTMLFNVKYCLVCLKSVVSTPVVRFKQITERK